MATTLGTRAKLPVAPAGRTPFPLWARLLARGASLAGVALLAWAVLALVNLAEGDLRQVQAPASALDPVVATTTTTATATA